MKPVSYLVCFYIIMVASSHVHKRQAGHLILASQRQLGSEFQIRTTHTSQTTNPNESKRSNSFINPQLREGTIVNAIQELSLDLSASQWEQGNSGNVVLSPVSISALLSLILLGTRGDANTELKRALRYPNNFPDAAIHDTFRTILGSIGQRSSQVNITMSSRLYLQEGLSILGTYIRAAQSFYNSQVNGLDFSVNPVEAAKIINDWVEESTYGKIKNLISKPFSPDTKFVAVNTIYFNGEWEFPFDKHFTYEGTFNTGKRNITIPMMTNLIDVPYLKGDQIGFDMVSLPYKGGGYAMIIITPKENSGIQSLLKVEYALNSDIIDRLIKRMSVTTLAVHIPRMKLTHKLYLKEDLKKLGVTTLFDPNIANFERISTNSGVYLSDIVHEAVIEVTETGTVAAAASAASLDRIATDEYFLVDRPSLVLIKDTVSSLTLFYSRVVEPEPIRKN